MATLPPIRRLVLEDYKTQQAWIGPLLQNINSFMDGTYNAFNKALTISQNTTGDMRNVTLVAVPTAAAPISFAWTKTNRPVAILVGNVSRVDGAALTLSSAVQVQWAFVGPSTIQITNVVGITPSTVNQYIVQLVILTG